MALLTTIGLEPLAMTPQPRKCTIRVDGVEFVYSPDQAAAAVERDTHITAWRPAGQQLAAAVESVEIGMPESDRPTSSEVAEQIRSVAALSFLIDQALKFGLRDVAIADAALMLVTIEKLAAAGSEDAAGSMQIAADRLRRYGIADEAVLAARKILKAAA
jgi:hypothetical protein